MVALLALDSIQSKLILWHFSNRLKNENLYLQKEISAKQNFLTSISKKRKLPLNSHINSKMKRHITQRVTVIRWYLLSFYVNNTRTIPRGQVAVIYGIFFLLHSHEKIVKCTCVFLKVSSKVSRVSFFKLHTFLSLLYVMCTCV